ncbi:MAG: prefoldin subunit [Candidatus Micrarchaeia archaeon]
MQGQEIEKIIKEYQLLQEQLRAFSLQLEQLQLQKSESTTAQAEIEKATGKIYITIGGVIVETDKSTALKNLKEKMETTDLRLQTTSKQFNELKAREKSLREKLSKMQLQQ